MSQTDVPSLAEYKNYSEAKIIIVGFTWIIAMRLAMNAIQPHITSAIQCAD